ncbi:MAG: hypothetical protein IPM98_17895 [Lewinellaceae bacterium]|nr:hypothetical protein [Lewinellaceae bacterium]
MDLQNAQLGCEGTPGVPEPLIGSACLPMEPDAAGNLLQTALRRHPALRLYDAKLRLLNVERRLKNGKA